MKFNSIIAYATLAASFGYSLPAPNVATSDLQARNVRTSGDITTSDGFPAKRNVATSNVATSKRNVATSDVEGRNVVSSGHLLNIFFGYVKAGF
jgi:hypothetical protein